MKKFLLTTFKITGLLILILFTSLTVLFLIYFFDEKDYCLDTNICKEGMEINTEHGLIKINKENCIKYNWKWDDKSKYCNMRDETIKELTFQSM